jgi:phage terminase large subunit GpA-like protein
MGSSPLMRVVKESVFPWQAVTFRCPLCGAHIALDVADLSGGVRPRQTMNGTWTTNMVQCEHCRAMTTLSEVNHERD